MKKASDFEKVQLFNLWYNNYNIAIIKKGRNNIIKDITLEIY